MNKYKLGPWLVLLAAVLWAVDAPFRKYLTTQLSSSTIVLMEHMTIAVLVLLFLFRYFKEFKNLSLKEWGSVIFIGFGGSALATVLFTQSFHYINPSVAILLQKVQPFIAIFLAFFILKERLHARFWVLAILAICGAYLVTFPGILIKDISFEGEMTGVVFALLAAFLWGGSTVLGKLVLRKISFQAMTALRFLSALIFLFIISLYYGTLGELKVASSIDWLFVFIIAIIAGFISLFIYYLGLKNTKASIATLCELAFPFAAVVVNWKFLGATLSAMQIFGGLVLLIAVIGLSYTNAKESATKTDS